MNEIAIIGAGGFGREVKWLIDRINVFSKQQEGEEKWKILGFIDDGILPGTLIDSVPVLGGCDYLVDYKKELFVVCAVGEARVREKIIKRIKKNKNINFPNLIDPSVAFSEDLKIGQGNIICAGSILTVNVQLEDFCLINLDCTVGHDAKIHSYVTLYPSVNISGQTVIDSRVEIGTGSHLIQGIKVGESSIIGAGTVVIRDIPGNCTAVGSPARIIRR